tara:strand:+ start:123 stop:317 length:195 start_codon:yes stop_codon:yes gene_type:complete
MSAFSTKQTLLFLSVGITILGCLGPPDVDLRTDEVLGGLGADDLPDFDTDDRLQKHYNEGVDEQ